MTSLSQAMLAAGVLAALLLGGTASGQRKKPKSLAVAVKESNFDPYTKNDPKKMAAAGIISFGPFPWNKAEHSSQSVRDTLGAPQIRWIETPHFKLGCDLAPRKRPTDRQAKKILAKDLKELRKKLPGLNTRVRKLDRWLLTHLFAMRLERTYAEFSKLLGVTEKDFPHPDREDPVHYMGEGPYLGQRAKYCVLLLDSEFSLQRYLVHYTDYQGKTPRPVRHDFWEVGSLSFATASSCHGGALYKDGPMHQHLVCEITKNLATGYKSNLFKLPTWWCEGLGHVVGRRLYPEIVLMDITVDPIQFSKQGKRWPVRVAQRTRKGYFHDTEKLFDRHAFHEWKIQDHLMAWSRVDYLMRKDPAGIKRFLDYCNTLKMPLRDFNDSRWRKFQRGAIQAGWGMSFAEFDAGWKKHALRGR